MLDIYAGNERRLHERYRGREELFSDASGFTICVDTLLTGKEQAELWEIMQSGFQDLNKKSYHPQNMTLEEFEEDMSSSRVLKFLATSPDGTVIGGMTVHDGLERISWIDTDICAEKQLEVDPYATSYYVGDLVVAPGARTAPTALRLLQSILWYLKNENQNEGKISLAFFDCANANDPVLARLLRRSASLIGDDFPPLEVDVTKLSETWYVQADAGGQVTERSMPAHAEDTGGEVVLDKQHLYMVQAY